MQIYWSISIIIIIIIIIFFFWYSQTDLFQMHRIYVFHYFYLDYYSLANLKIYNSLDKRRGANKKEQSRKG